ncbi:MAG: DUF192 domain-containing protein [Candidatus Altiarchaeia archaeon]
MKKTFVLLGIFLIVVSGGCTDQKEKNIRQVCHNEKCFDVELAETDEQRQRGLMGRESLDENKGMLFVYEENGIHTFWMKDTLIPLDMIWIDGDGTVVRIIENAEPCPKEYCPSINPNRKARYVLEINGGEANRTGLAEGSRLSFAKA